MRLMLLLFGLCAFALSLDSEAIAQAEDSRLSDLLRESREKSGAVGMGAGVMIDGEVVALATDGDRIIGEDTPISPEAVWHLGSITKSMTATMIAALVEDDVLSFETTIGDIYGETAHESWRGVTLEQLLTHRSGAPSNFGLVAMLRPDPSSLDGIARQRQARVDDIIGAPRPGQTGEYRYSNVGFTIAGAMAEKAAGAPWETLVTEHVFTPLGITPTFGAPKGEAAPWGHAEGLFGKAPRNPHKKADNPRFMGPAGTVALSLEDLLRYGGAHAAQAPALLSRSSYDRLRTPPQRDETTGSGYAYGWIIEPDGGPFQAAPVFWHNGSNTMWYAVLIVLPEERAVLAITANDGDLDSLEPVFLDLANRMIETYGLAAPDAR